MKKIYLQVICFAIAIIATTYTNPISAQVIFPVAGNGLATGSGDGGPATAAEFNHAYGVVVDLFGNTYISESLGNRIRKIDPSGIVTTIAGTGTASSTGDGGPATAATLNKPQGLAVDGVGNLYIAENGANKVRKIDASGVITTFLGVGITGPTHVCTDASGNVYVGSFTGGRVFKITPSGTSTLYAGTSAGSGGDGGPATAVGAQLNRPTGLAMDASGNLYIATQTDNRIRKVDASGILSTVAGSTAGFSGDGGPASAAQFNRPLGLAIDGSGNLLIVDGTNQRIRKINTTTGIISTIAGTGAIGAYIDYYPATVTPMSTLLNVPEHVFVDASGNIFFNDGNRARKIVPCTSGLPVITAISGPSNVCEAATAIYSTPTTGGAWSVSNPAIGTIDAAGNFTGIAGGEDTVKYTVVNGCGTTIATAVVTVDPLPAVGALGGLPEVCVGSSISLPVSPSGGTWSATNGTATVTGGVVTGVTMGVDTIMYAITNLCGTTTVSKEVTVNPLPDPGTLSGPVAVCLGSTITIASTVTGGSWSASNANAVVSSGSVTGVTAGVDTIEYTVANICGTATATHTVTVTLTPYVDPIVGSPVVCIGGVTPFTDPTPGGVWSSTTGNASVNSTSGDVLGVATGPDVIKYSVTLPCGTTTVSYSISVDAPPTVGSISGPSTVCAGSNITLTNPTSGGFWYASNANATVTGSGVVTGVTAGIDTIAYNVSNACGAASAFQYITVLPLPDSGTISGSSAVCVASSVTLSESVSGGVWGITNPSATMAGGVVTGVTDGLDTVTYSVTNFCGTAVARFPITVVPLPDAGTISGPSMVCEASTIVLTDPVLGGIWGTVDTNGSVSTSGVLSGVHPGLDTVTFSYTNMCGTDVTTYPVTVNPLPHAGTITGPAEVCVSATVIVADTASGGVWTSVGSLVNVGSGTGLVMGMTIGVDTIVYTVTNICGVAVVKRPVTVNDIPVMTPVTGASEVCVGGTATVATTSTGGVWSKSNASVNINSGGVITGISVGTVTISYTKTNSCGPNSSLRTVNVLTTPVAGTVTGPDTICINEFNPLTTTVSGGTWTVSDTNTFVDATGVVVGHSVGVATVTYTVANICGSAYTTFRVVVREDTFCHPLGINGVASTDARLSIFPNPNNGSFSVLLAAPVTETAEVVVSNVLGETVSTFSAATNRPAEVHLNLPAGIYLLNANTSMGRRTTRVIIQ